MKNFIPIMLIISFMLACSQNDEVSPVETDTTTVLTKEELKNADLQSSLNYIDFHMSQLTLWVSKHTEVILEKSIREQKSSKTNEFPTLKMETLYHEIEGAVSKSNPQTSDLMTSLTAFEGVHEMDWYPIVYVYDNGNLNQENSTDQKVYIAVETVDDKGEAVKAYERTSDNKLIPILEPFNEEFVGDNILIVVELDFKDQMSTDLTPELPEIFDEEAGSGGGGSGGTTPTPRKRTLKIDRMKIKDLKEGWPARSEIAFKGYKVTTVVPGTLYRCGEDISASVNCYTYTGKRITKLKRRYRNKMKSYNWTISYEPYDSNAIVFYVIFEADFAPFHVSSKRLPDGTKFEIPYSSWNNEYDDRQLSLSNSNSLGFPLAYGFSENDSVIEYYLK